MCNSLETQQVLQLWHIMAAVVHGILTIVILTAPFFKELRTLPNQPLYILLPRGIQVNATNSTSTSWVLEPCAHQTMASLNAHALVEVFNLVTCFAHVYYAILCRKAKNNDSSVYPNTSINQGVFFMRWIEYSISASVMILLLLLQIGARSLFTHLLAAAMTIVVMLSGGFVAQKAQQLRVVFKFPPVQRKALRIQIMLFLLAWSVLLVTWIPIWTITAQTIRIVSENNIEDFPKGLIQATVVVETFAFFSFGLIECMALFTITRKRNIRREKMYILLSVSSKVILIFLASASLTNMPLFREIDGQCVPS